MDSNVMVKAQQAAKRILPGVKWGTSGRRVYGGVAGTQVSIEWDSIRGWYVHGFTVAQGIKREDRIDLRWLFAGLEPALRADWLRRELKRRRRARVWR